MTTTTVKRMNLLIQRNESRISIKVPREMKEEVRDNAQKMNMSDSQYIKLAIAEQLELDRVNK